MLRAVLFDAVGTLIYPDPPVAEAYFRVGSELGSRRTPAEVRQLFGQAYQRSESLFALPGIGDGLDRRPTSDELERKRWRQVVGEVFADLSASAADEALDRLWRHFALADHWKLFADAGSAWNELSRRGYVLGIASNFDSRLKGILSSLPPLDRCEHLFISSEIGFPKPSQHFFRAVERALRLSPQEIVLVGDDRTSDVLGALRCGWHSRLLLRNAPAEENSISSLQQLVHGPDALP